MSSIRGPRWCRYLTEKCLPDSHLPFVYVMFFFFYISTLENQGIKSIEQIFQKMDSHANFQEKLS